MHPCVSLETLTPDDLRPFLNTAFNIHGNDSYRSQVTLTEVTDIGPKTAGRRSQFAIVFSGTCGEVWPQQIYRLEHEKLGTLDVFLVPISASPDGTRYEAVFA
jgi:hypothetical protein